MKTKNKKTSKRSTKTQAVTNTAQPLSNPQLTITLSQQGSNFCLETASIQIDSNTMRRVDVRDTHRLLRNAVLEGVLKVR